MLTKAAFELFADLLSDASLLITADGRIEDANRRAREMLELELAEVADFDLTRLVNDPVALRATLIRCARSSEGIPVSVRLEKDDRLLTGWGALVRPPTEERPGTVFLRLSETDVRRRFELLNEKLDQLATELDRRKTAEDRLLANEKSLQEQIRLAAFTGDVALAISQETDLDRMLGVCAQLLVDRLDAAFARIWLLEPDDSHLTLRASAGQYTHLDGEHSRIEIGQFKIGRIAQGQVPHMTNSVIGDPNVHDQDWARREGMVSFAGHPLVVEGLTIGVMALFARHELSQSTTAALASVAGALASGVLRKRIESDLRESVAALKQADQRKNEYVAMLAHELRGPLAPIRHLVEQLRRGGDVGAVLPRIDQQLEHVVRLVDDLLDMSRVSQGKISLSPRSVDVHSLIETAIEAVKHDVDRHKHRLEVELPEHSLRIQADSFRLRQILINLLHNAVKYTPEGGEIKVSAERVGDQLEIRVSDNGIGIEPEFLPRLFDMFAQSTRSLDRKQGGLGLGLTLARSLAEAHGGTLTASSPGLGEGSTFRLNLSIERGPVATGKHPTLEQPLDKRAPAIPQARVLLVDDNRESADTLHELLELMGCASVEVVYDGSEGLERASRSSYDLLILDIGLPGLNGYELAATIRSSTPNKAALLVALTGYGGKEEQKRSREAGFDRHLVKPLDVSQLEQLFASD